MPVPSPAQMGGAGGWRRVPVAEAVVDYVAAEVASALAPLATDPAREPAALSDPCGAAWRSPPPLVFGHLGRL